MNFSVYNENRIERAIWMTYTVYTYIFRRCEKKKHTNTRQTKDRLNANIRDTEDWPYGIARFVQIALNELIPIDSSY